MVLLASGDKPDATKLGANPQEEAGGMNLEFDSLPDNLIPLKNTCYIMPAKPKEKVGSIILHHSTNEGAEYAMQVGKIAAVGPLFYKHGILKTIEDTAPKIGDIVFFAPYEARRMVVNGVKFLILDDTMVLGNGIKPDQEIKIFT